jgi:hypothetical protein
MSVVGGKNFPNKFSPQRVKWATPALRKMYQVFRNIKIDRQEFGSMELLMPRHFL